MVGLHGSGGGKKKRADVGIRPYGVEGTYGGLMEVGWEDKGEMKKQSLRRLVAAFHLGEPRVLTAAACLNVGAISDRPPAMIGGWWFDGSGGRIKEK